MKLVFIHGWGVTSTTTYGELPQALVKLAPASLALQVQHIYLGRYISFNDAVTLDDIAIAFEAARLRELGDSEFSVITHSTGGPLIRQWLARYYGSATDGVSHLGQGVAGGSAEQLRASLSRSPLTHLVMLAPANHGSALAQLGKSRVSRLKAWFDGVEPGQQVLDWLELGSDGQHRLNLQWLNWDLLSAQIYPFVLTGESIDSALYDYVNSYTGEVGSDGVVRVCAANMNFVYGVLQQGEAQCRSYNGQFEQRFTLQQLKQPQQECAFEVLPRASHSHKKMGILNSVTRRNADKKPVVQRILACLSVTNSHDYRQLSAQMSHASASQRTGSPCCMLVLRISDHLGYRVTDFDLYLLAGDDYHPGKLPRGLVIDKQRNSVNGNVITLYLDARKLAKISAGKLGIKLVARPESGFTYYKSAEFHCMPAQLAQLITADKTLMLDLIIQRHIAANTVQLTHVGEEPDFKQTKAKDY